MPDICHRHFATIDSTNTQLMLNIADGTLSHTAPHLYTASHQTAGRGQHGRTWVSGDDNVYLSLYVPLGTGAHDLHRLSGLLSLAVGFGLTKLPIITHINAERRRHQLPTIGVKWANDVGYYDGTSHLFHKLAGILIEPTHKKLGTNQLVGVVIGVGLNVNSAPVISDGLYQATCLAHLYENLKLTAADIYQPMTDALLNAVKICNDFNYPDSLSAFIDDFNHSHILQHKNIAIFMQNNTCNIHAQGNCIGIGRDGELLLKNNDALMPIYAGMAQIIWEMT